MNFTERPLFDSPSPSRSGAELDGLLSRFFQAVLPNPWPACPEPPVTVLPSPLPRSRWALARSRFALAASVGLIVAGLWAVGGKFTGPGEAPGSLGNGDSATHIKPYGPPKPADPNKAPSNLSLFQDPENGTGVRVDVLPYFDK